VLLLYKEAINNIAKHSGATEVSISMQRNGQLIMMVIKDNGRWKGHEQTSGAGLLSMQQRARTMSGELKVSHDKEGTVVQLSIVLP
jgi:signal transduction histidine kinase